MERFSKRLFSLLAVTLGLLVAGFGAVAQAAPTIPTGLNATSTSSSGAMLNWTGSTDPSFTPAQLYYNIYRDGIQVATTTLGTLNFDDLGLSSSTPYSYAVSATNPSGESSGLSSSTMVTTLAPMATSTPTSTPPTAPSAPTNLTASGTSPSQIMLNWSASATTSTGTISGYHIIRNGLHVASTTATTYLDMGLSPSTTYSYNVYGSDSNGMSSNWSTTVFGTTLASATTTPPTAPTSTPPIFNIGNGTVGWLVLPAEWFDKYFNATGTPSSTTTPGSPFTYINGYPTINGNYYDCYGNIDNDMGHHTTDPNDTDPAHHSGQNCPGGSPKIPTNMSPGMNGGGMHHGMMPSWLTVMGDGTKWVVIPLNNQTLATLFHIVTQPSSP